MNSAFLSTYGFHQRVMPQYSVPLSPPPFFSMQDPYLMASMNSALKGGSIPRKNDFQRHTSFTFKDYSNRRSSPCHSPEPSAMNNKPQAKEIYSRKVFVGGLPIDTKESTVKNIFSAYGKVLIDWPRRLDSKPDQLRPMAGYVFLVFEEEASVQLLVEKCHKDAGNLYLFVTSDTMRFKPVQIRPWMLADSDYMIDPEYRMDSRLTVFIGGVPRPTRAIEIAEALNPIYGPIAYVGVDTDPELKYPKGCARVTFGTAKGFIAALKQRHVNLNHTETSKRVEIKPYLMEEQMCDNCYGQKCSGQNAPYFCGFDQCLQYYCNKCWDHIHGNPNSSYYHHRPTVRQGFGFCASSPAEWSKCPFPSSIKVLRCISWLKSSPELQLQS